MKWILIAVLMFGLGTAQARQAVGPTASADEVREMRSRLADWAQLARYRMENDSVPPQKDRKRVVFFGSSTTDNWGRKYNSVFFPGKPYINRGIGGQTTPQMLVRFQQDVVALHPAAVVFLGGTNDVAGNTGPMTLAMTQDNIRSMVAIAEANGIIVILASQLPVIDFPWNKGTHPEAALRAMTAWEKQYAAEHKLGYIDYYTALVGTDGSFRGGLSVDGVHPTAAGYAVMAPLAQTAIDKAIGAR